MRPRRRPPDRRIPSSSARSPGWQQKLTQEERRSGACGVRLLESYGLEIRFVRLRHRLKALVKMIIVVLGADDFAQWAAVRAPITLDRIPWCREGTGVFDVDIHLERLAIFDHVEALHNMQLVGVWRLIVVDIGFAGDSDRVDHKSVALVMTD